MAEREEQQLLILWARQNEERVPELELLFHPPNGGWRHISTATRLKRMGARAGVPDLCLPVPRRGYHGLWIEMKYGHNRPTSKQRWWLDQLKGLGYRAEVCYSGEEARDVLVDYLGVEDAGEWICVTG